MCVTTRKNEKDDISKGRRCAQCKPSVILVPNVIVLCTSIKVPAFLPPCKRRTGGASLEVSRAKFQASPFLLIGIFQPRLYKSSVLCTSKGFLDTSYLNQGLCRF